MSNMVEILITAKDLAGPALGRARADAARLQAEAARQSAMASATAGRRRALEVERERLYAAEQASIARRSAGQTTAAQRAAEREQIALARRANQQQIAMARTAEREQVAAARRASAQVAAAQREQVAGAQAAAGKLRTALAGAAIATAAIGVESIKMASKFDASMTLLQTQAGVAKSQMGVLKKGVLDLAGKVGQDPDSLAKSLFHVESNFESMGISSSKALKLVETAAKGATLGHADLVDVTNALTAAVASGIPGVKNFDQAMGVLNATVGTGDMTMQDLANAFGSGMVATVAGFGLSIKDVGAALAVFGDNNIRGSLAGNQLRMSVMALAKPVSTAKDALDKLGLKQDTLAKDMQKGGLLLAMQDLVDRLHKAGVSAKEQGQIITDAFGRKAGSGLNTLVREFDKFQSKYPAATEGAHKFGQAWADTKKTFAFQMKSLQGDFDALMIKIGFKLMPVVQKFVEFLKGDFAKTAGPMLTQELKLLGTVGGEAFTALGVGFKILKPFVKDVAAGFQALMEATAPIADMFKGVGAAIFDAIVPHGATNKIVGPFQELRDVIRENKGAILEAARQMGDVFIVMAEMAMKAMPALIGGFHLFAAAALESFGVVVNGAAAMFKWVPGVGAKLAAAAKGFDTFKDKALAGLDKADAKASAFAASTVPKLEHNRLTLDIRNWDEQIKTAKGQLDKVPASKRAKLLAHIKDLQDKVAQARADLGSLKDKTVSAKARDNASRTLRAVAGLLAGLNGKTATSYVNTVYRKFVESTNAPQFKADGGPIVGGSGTQDDVPVMAMGGEFMVRKGPAQKHRALLEAINDDRLPKYAKGGHVKLTKAQQKAKAAHDAELQARHEAMGDLTISHFGHMAGYQRSEFGSALAKPDSLSSLVNALNQWRANILKATHGGQEKSLLRALDSSGKKLLSWEKQLGKVSASLEKAKDKLNSLKDSAAQLSDSVKSGILGSANITKNATDGGPVTVSSVMGGLTQSRDKASALSNALKSLKAKGLSSALIQQIAEAGVEGGGLETAGALQGASTSEISSLNSLQSQITSSATSAGKTTSDAVYAKAIAAQEKTVKALTKSQDSLKKSMDKLTKSLEKMVQKAFSSKKAAGGIVGAAASGGLRSGLTMVGEQGFELLDLPAGSRVWSNPDSRRKLAAAQAPWSSMLNSPRRGSSYGAAGGEREVKVVLEIRAGNSSQYSRFLVEELRKAVRTGGGIDQTLRPPRGR
ncbi:phage tail tape measure protein [Streptomyces sp. NPDC050523]|uniref:phage tail tape measure protein n=1 Tax=Streptomyces sp. NPDC050523 TaxID=3365622 RepID=UPI00378D1EF1